MTHTLRHRLGRALIVLTLGAVPLGAVAAPAALAHRAVRHHHVRHHRRPRKHHVTSSGIPQNNGGDMDGDNNGGPSDGDGNI